MGRTLSQLQPAEVWHYFNEILQIPRHSHHEEAIRKYLITTAKKLNLDYKVNNAGSLLFRKSATTQRLQHKKIILHAHMNLASTKSNSVSVDLNNDTITTQVNEDWLTATNTSLGADNGIGLAMALAILSKSDLAHNDLEVLITAKREDSMPDAINLQDLNLAGEILINLDSEEQDEVCIGCAGIIETNITLPLNWQTINPANSCAILIGISDLYSGHSGVDIMFGRANAIKEMALLLYLLNLNFNFQLVSINGGQAHDQIPESCTAIIVLPATLLTAVSNFIRDHSHNLQEEYRDSDPNLQLIIKPYTLNSKYAIADAQAKSILSTLVSIFNGVWRINYELGIAETSSNLGVIITNEQQLQIKSIQRSAHDAAKIKLAQALAAPFIQMGAQVVFARNYPSWQANLQSYALQTTIKLYRKLFNEEINIRATHGDLECGLIINQLPHLDAISLGATIRFPHSQLERVSIQSAERAWQLLTRLIKEL